MAGTKERRKAGKGSGALWAMVLGAVLIAAAFAALFVTRASADYADGIQAKQSLALEEAVEIWRKAAWQQDDFFSQVALGDLYSDDQGFRDPVEAYVWYYLALRPNHYYAVDDDDRVGRTMNQKRREAFSNMQQIFDSLTLEQRMEARSRIIYILASRGSEGFIALGKLHREYGRPQQGQPAFWPPAVIVTCNDQHESWFSGIWRWLFGGHEKRRPDCHRVRVPWPDSDNSQSDNYSLQSNGFSSQSTNYSSQSGNYSTSSSTYNSQPTNDTSATSSPSVSMSPSDNTSQSISTAPISTTTSNSGGDYGYYNNDNNSAPSVIVRNDEEALMYFDIAANLGHPLAKDYIASHEAEMSSLVGDMTRIEAEATARARVWMPPFEFYPGATAGGVPHTDESLPSMAQRAALARVGEIPFWAVEDALAFRGLLRGQRGAWRVPPAVVAQAIRKFQSALNFEPTGFLAPHEGVRLIQMSAVDGDAEMQNRLGIMYAKGVGVPQNFPRAEKWFSLAAKQRFGEALYNLGVLYKVGPNGVPQDKDKAARLFVESALAGYNPARNELRDLLMQADDADRNHGARR